MTPLFVISVILSLISSILCVPVIRSLAHLIGIVDKPDRERKLHEVPVALGGGIAVFIAIGIAFAATIAIDRHFFSSSLGDLSSQWYGLFAASIAMLFLGLIDDVWALRGRQKLLVQCLIIASLVGGGTLIDRLGFFGIEMQLGIFAYPVTILWLLLAVNALNLIDGADGVATTAGAIISLGFGFLSFQSNDMLSAVAGFAIAGALGGFLVFNRPPATIYLGDSGSMMIGLLVGVLAVWSNVKESTVFSAAPLAILAIPLFDSTAAILRRWLTGRSIYAPDRAHLHHVLNEKYGPIGMLYVVAAICSATTVMAVLSIYWDQTWIAIVGVLIVLGLLVSTRSFGHAEARLVMGRATHFAQSLATVPSGDPNHRHHRRVSLQGDGPWETVWEPLVVFAESHNLARVKIDLSMAWLHEGYHANWQSVRMPEKASLLSVCVPLFATCQGESIQIGRLEIYASAKNAAAYECIANIGDQLDDLHPEIQRIISALEAGKRSDQIPVESREQLPQHQPSSVDNEPAVSRV